MSDLLPTSGNRIIAADVVDGVLTFKRYDGTTESFPIGGGGAVYRAENPEIIADEGTGEGIWIIEHNLDTDTPQVTIWQNLNGISEVTGGNPLVSTEFSRYEDVKEDLIIIDENTIALKWRDFPAGLFRIAIS